MGALSFITRKQVNINTTLPVKSQAAVPAKTEAGLPEKRTPLQVELSDNARAIRDERWQFCYEVIAMTKRTNMGQEKCCQIIAARDHERYPLLCRAGKNNTSALTYNNCRHWLRLLGTLKKRDGSRDYNWDNVAALADRYTTGKQPKKFNNLVFKIFCAEYLGPNRPKLTVAYRETKELFKREFPEIVFPSVAQIRYQLQRLPQNTIDAGRYGIDYVFNRSLYMLIRDWDKIMSGQCYFADSRTFDQLVRVPDGDGWKAVRPIVTFIMDAKSWYCVGFDTTAESVNADMIRNVFAQACVTHGIPDFFYIDNGKDYNKSGFTSPVEINGLQLSIIQSLGVKRVNSKPYCGRSKTVERRFREDAENFDRCQASYVGNSPGNRPEKVELLYKGDNVMLLPTVGQFNVMLQAVIDKFHHSPLGGHLRGKTPHEVFFGPDRLVKPPKSEKELYFALLQPDPKTRKVYNGGCINIDNIRYYAPELFELTGKYVIIKRSLPERRIHAFTLDNKHIGECTAQETTHPLAHHIGTDEDKKRLDEQLVIQGRQRRDVLDDLDSVTNGLYGLAINEIKTLSRKQLEGGVKLVQLAEKQSVKGGTHHVKLLVTPEQVAAIENEKNATQQQQLAITKSHKTKHADRQAFDASFEKLMTAQNTDCQPEQEFADFTL